MKAILLSTPYTRTHLETSIGEIIEVHCKTVLFHHATITYEDGTKRQELLRDEDFKII